MVPAEKATGAAGFLQAHMKKSPYVGQNAAAMRGIFYFNKKGIGFVMLNGRDDWI